MDAETWQYSRRLGRLRTEQEARKIYQRKKMQSQIVRRLEQCEIVKLDNNIRQFALIPRRKARPRAINDKHSCRNDLYRQTCFHFSLSRLWRIPSKRAKCDKDSCKRDALIERCTCQLTAKVLCLYILRVLDNFRVNLRPSLSTIRIIPFIERTKAKRKQDLPKKNNAIKLKLRNMIG